jgi:hypothetical protein
MTNADKYRLTGIEAYNLSQELGEYLTIEKKAEGVFVSDINSYFVRATKPTLTEDERVILRNIKNNKAIGRDKDNCLYFGSKGDGRFFINSTFGHLFQFIKERRRI